MQSYSLTADITFPFSQPFFLLINSTIPLELSTDNLCLLYTTAEVFVEKSLFQPEFGVSI